MVDEYAADELYTFIVNDYELYNRMQLPIERNLRRKWDKGTYEERKGIRGWEHLVMAGARKYRIEFPTAGLVFNRQLREHVATEMEEAFRLTMQAEDKRDGKIQN
jgi:hypothetical protein